jgi:hypothetical protein
MRLLYVADLHCTLKQFDRLPGEAGAYDLVGIGGTWVFNPGHQPGSEPRP